jgi:hypothetical protein
MKMLSRTTAVMGAAGLVAAGLAAATPASANHNDVFQIKVTEVQTDYDDDYSGVPEEGDTFQFTSNLRQDGDRVGKDRGECEFTRIIGDDDDPTAVVVRCVIRFQFFERGTMRAAGKVRIDYDDLQDSDFDVKLPIRSGTGDYDDAEGTVRNEQLSDTKSRLTFRLTGVDH